MPEKIGEPTKSITLLLVHGFVWALPRTSHWTATALENAGFKIRDIVTHVYGSGFPKNFAIDKSIDTSKYKSFDEIYPVTEWIRKRRDELGLRNKDLDEIAGIKGGASHWTAISPSTQAHVPTLERWNKLRVLKKLTWFTFLTTWMRI